MNRVQKLIFFLALFHLIFCAKDCKKNKGSGACISDDDTYVCIKKQGTQACVSKPRCEYAEADETSCSDYPVSKNKEKTDICISNPGENSNVKPCLQITLCKFLTENVTDNICRQHPVNPRLATNHSCILNSTSQHCEETLNCIKVPKSEKLDYINFATPVGKICIENENGDTDTKCRE